MIGYRAGSGGASNATNAISIGTDSGSYQYPNSIAIGYQAANYFQYQNSIAIGNAAGGYRQYANSIAIGFQAGFTNQGTQSIAIGNSAGKTNQVSNSIVINAAPTMWTDTTYQFNQGLYIKPVRGISKTTPVIVYDTTSCELTYNTSSIKYKKNVIDLTEDTSVLHNIRAREYDTIDNNTHMVGYIAEELNDVSSWFTWKNPDGTPEGIEWFNLLIYSIEEIKKLKNQVTTLTERIQILENK